MGEGVDFRENPPVPVPTITSINIIDNANHNNKIEFTLYNEIWAAIQVLGDNLKYARHASIKGINNNDIGFVSSIIEQSNNRLVIEICCWNQLSIYTLKLQNTDNIWTQEYGQIVVE